MRFEDLEIWQLSRQLTNEIYNVSFKNDFSLANQIRRAAVSIMSNIAEGFERGGNQELTQFLYIAKGSCGEVRCQLYIALDHKYITDDEFQKLQKQAVKISVKLSNLISYIKNSRFSGTKYKKPDLPSLNDILDEISKEMAEEGATKVVQK